MIIKKVAWWKFKFNLLKIQVWSTICSVFFAGWWYKNDGVWWMILK